MSEKRTNVTGLLYAFISGAFAGAAIALFYAPMSGKRLQRKVADVADTVADKVEDLQDQVRRFTKS